MYSATRVNPGNNAPAKRSMTPNGSIGWALFYIRGVAPEKVRTVEIYRGVA